MDEEKYNELVEEELEERINLEIKLSKLITILTITLITIAIISITVILYIVKSIIENIL